MRQSVIAFILEPPSLSLAGSLSWQIVSGLKSSRRFSVGDGSSARVIGAMPLLQPIRAQVADQSAILMALRLVVEGSLTPLRERGKRCAFLDQGNSQVGVLVGCPRAADDQSLRFRALGLTGPFLSLSEELERKLRSYVVITTGWLWRREPINWTTHNLHLASDNSFKTAEEMAALSLDGGLVRFQPQGVSVVPTTPPITLRYRPDWAGAGAPVSYNAGTNFDLSSKGISAPANVFASPLTGDVTMPDVDEGSGSCSSSGSDSGSGSGSGSGTGTGGGSGSLG